VTSISHAKLEVNLFDTWSVSRAFVPLLARNGGGALVNMVSVASRDRASAAQEPGRGARRPEEPGHQGLAVADDPGVFFDGVRSPVWPSGEIARSFKVTRSQLGMPGLDLE
jgi:NAD(P)-dependent dehydrogenase (short-subunit alcohol dehydrogenase family)